MHISDLGVEFVSQQTTPVMRATFDAAERAVNAVVSVELTQGQFDALCSLALSSEWAEASTLLVKLNGGDYYGAADQFLQHVTTADGFVSQALYQRRRAERSLFLGDTPTLPDLPRARR